MEYQVYKIFEAEDFNKITEGIKIAHCMGSSSIEDLLTSKCTKHMTVTGLDIIQSTCYNMSLKYFSITLFISKSLLVKKKVLLERLIVAQLFKNLPLDGIF
jgi:hypothetical protein